MRIEAVGLEGFKVDALATPDMASELAAELSYAELKGINTNIRTGNLDDNSGVRFLREGRYRGIDLYEVTKALQLSRKGHKIMVLKLLQRPDLMKVIGLLDKDKLIMGLRFFTKEKLLRLMHLLPKSMLIKMLLHVLTIKALIKLLPPTELFNILKAGKLDNREMLKGFHVMDPMFLWQIMQKLLSMENPNLTHREMMQILFTTKKHLILDAMKNLPYKALQPFVQFFVERDPKLLENLSDGFIFKLFERMPKGVLMSTFAELPKDTIANLFIGQLPTNFLVLVAAQIDEAELSKYLMASQPNLLAMLAA